MFPVSNTGNAMSASNRKTRRSHVYSSEQLAGGSGALAAKQDALSQLRRATLACLLFENAHYESGEDIAKNIVSLVHSVSAEDAAAVAIESRHQQKLRHVPLLIAREVLRHKGLKPKMGEDTLASVINRPDELSEFLSLYWKTNDGKKTLSAQAKKGLARAFAKFNEYQFSKWDRGGKEVSIRDAMFLSHPKPTDESLYKKIASRSLATADTWEVGLSAAKTPEEKRDVWCRLIADGKLGALALMKNLRNMQQVNVPARTISSAIRNASPAMLLPIDFIRAARYAPSYLRDIEDLMYKCASNYEKIPGWSVFIVDVSGSMNNPVSSRSEFTRLDAALAMTILASEMCEQISIYATAGCDMTRTGATARIPSARGFLLAECVVASRTKIGGGGIFTRQCLEWVRLDLNRESPDRVIVFSDSQDCDTVKAKPVPFGRFNYICDISSHRNGINYDGCWTAEISGWSENFLRFVHEYEQTLN